jgi:hypothetical protein
MNHVAKPRLTVAGRVVLGILFVAGWAACLWLCLYAGLVLGLEKAQPALTRETKGVGLAPDLSGAVEGTFTVGGYYLGGIAVGALGGLVVVGLAIRFALLPLARRIPGLARRELPPPLAE